MDDLILDHIQDETTPKNIQYATFWRRVWASILDQLILSVAGSILGYIFRGSVEAYILTIFTACITVVYKIYLEKEYGQTLGKFMTNIKVADKDFKPLTYEQVIKRNYYTLVSTALALLMVFNIFGIMSLGQQARVSYSEAIQSQIFHPITLICGIIYCIDCLAMTSNPTKKTLHDMWGRTIVIKLN